MPSNTVHVSARTKFMLTKQVNVAIRSQIKKKSKYCDFGKLWTKDTTMEDELIFFGLIESIQNTLHKDKILARLQVSSMDLEANIEFLQLDLIKGSVNKRLSRELPHTTKFMIKGTYCSKEYERNKNKCLSLDKICSNFKK